MFIHSRVSDRVKRLREHFRGQDTNRKMPVLSAEIPRLLTEAYQLYEADPVIVKRAKALKYIAERITLAVKDDELIVGNVAPFDRSGVLWLEYGVDWFWDELESGVYESRDIEEEGHTISKEDKEYLLSIKDFWKNKSLSARLHASAPEGMTPVFSSGVTQFGGKYMANNATGHFCSNYNKVVTKGFAAVKQEAEEKMRAMQQTIQGDDGKKYHFYKAVSIACEASIIFAKRYAEVCRAKAAEVDEQRAAELMRMAESLDWIFENPCRNFRDAIQAVHLYHIVMCVDSNLHALTYGRVDQYLWPYLEKDLAAGDITMDEAQELIDCFCLKVSESTRIWSCASARNNGGYSANQNITIGGQNAEGTDATNPISYMFLQSMSRLVLRDPPLSLRVHKGTPADLWEAGLMTSSIVGGIPVFENDEIIIPALINRGIKYQDALDYCIIGCVEPAVTGAEWSACGGTGKETYFNLLNVFVLAINNGINPMNGVQAGLQTGYLWEMENMEQVKEAVKTQLNYFLDWQMTMTNLYEIAAAEMRPIPVVSAMMDGCMENGADVTSGGAKYNGTGVSAIGVANISDCLAAVEYMIFDEKRCTAKELMDALAKNWEGCEPLRQQILNFAPHFGNDDDRVDKYARWICSLFADKVNATRSPRGYFKSGLYPVSAHIMYGLMTAATPDGRFAKEPLADGISPKQGLDRNGPAAIFNSVAKLNTIKFGNGTLLNMKFHPKIFEGSNPTQKLRDLIETFFDMNGMHVQFNVVSSDTLRDAQKNPEEYRDLVVRVAGFSAYFVELYKDLQNDIIRRNDLTL